ncbi:MAG: hypothetical protein NTW29_11270 [Bacteroidetes bacterium]|nr:hypothetical protein [Bacteroidota bacterium]
MRIIGFIWAIYILLLAAIPCCAFDDCPDDKPLSAASHEQGDNDCGNCSPFFNCEGCATATAEVELLSFDIPRIPVSAVHTGYIPQTTQSVHFDFWQPPRLG